MGHDDNHELGVVVADGRGEDGVCTLAVGIGGERVGRGVGEGHSQSVIEIELHTLIMRDVEVGADGVGMVNDVLSRLIV